MTLQASTAARNGMLDAIETALGASPILRIRTGAQPANCAAARTGTVLATIPLSADSFGNAASGAKSITGTPEDTSCDATGDPGYWEIMDSAGTTCHLQGPATAPWQASRNYSVGAHVVNGGLVYRCTTAGVAAASGGPTGTGASIADGAAVWAYVDASVSAAGALALISPITAGMGLTISSFQLTAPGA